MSRVRTRTAFVSRLVIGVCASAFASAGTPAGIPAVLVNPSVATQRELARVIGRALDRPSVTLADDALTATNRISLEHARPRDAAGRLLNGRELSRPETFELYLRRSRCVLVRSSSGRSWTLRRARCAPMPAAP